VLRVNLRDVVRDLAEVPRKATIYVPREAGAVDGDTPVLLVLSDDDPPAGWRYLLEVLLAREVVEVWRSWRDDRVPTLDEACEAIVYYADNDAYQPED
jgi:hypothetical protein